MRIKWVYRNATWFLITLGHSPLSVETLSQVVIHSLFFSRLIMSPGLFSHCSPPVRRICTCSASIEKPKLFCPFCFFTSKEIAGAMKFLVPPVLNSGKSLRNIIIHTRVADNVLWCKLQFHGRDFKRPKSTVTVLSRLDMKYGVSLPFSLQFSQWTFGMHSNSVRLLFTDASHPLS